jgi:hypothetical protein
MSVKRYDFLRILRATALTSLVCFSSSAVYAMAEDDSAPASKVVTYRTTGSNPRAVHNHSFIFFGIDKVVFDFTQPLEISINHRSPDEKMSSLVTLFDDRNNRYHPIGKLSKSEDFTSTSYSVGISDWYSHLLVSDKPKMLQLSFQGGVSDIHSVTLQQGETRKKVLQSIVLGDQKSEERPEVCMRFPEAPNEWSKAHRVTPKSSSFSLELLSPESRETVGKIRSLAIKHETKDSDDLIEEQDFPFSDRLIIARSLGDSALFKLATNISNELEDRMLAAKCLTGAMRIVAARRLQEDLEDYNPERFVRDCVGGRSSLPLPKSE